MISPAVLLLFLIKRAGIKKEIQKDGRKNS